ncbi:hypothetical protein MMC19_006289 [Ptychographa xylographoides]|nr:hypothetical protein [Ptychographa xylographoides]
MIPHRATATPIIPATAATHSQHTTKISPALVVELVPPVSPDPLPPLTAFEVRKAYAEEEEAAADSEIEAATEFGVFDDVIELDMEVVIDPEPEPEPVVVEEETIELLPMPVGRSVERRDSPAVAPFAPA